MESKITNCRICDSTKLQDFLSLGVQALTGVFPSSTEEKITEGELLLTKCEECDLVQLRHNFPLTQMYGDNYGYRSGLNQSMIDHLGKSVSNISSKVEIDEGDLIIDIGSNDGTLLSFYPNNRNLNLLGVDPTGKKFKEYYREDIKLIPEFFPSKEIGASYPNKKAKIITSFSCFYDLERPIDFAKSIAELLDDNGLWVFEQSYLPFMIQTISYDTICHEHLEYYCLKQIKRITEAAGLVIVDVAFNDVNGGSFCVYAAKPSSTRFKEDTALVNKIINEEKEIGYFDLNFFKSYADIVKKHRLEVMSFFEKLKTSGEAIVGLGASTKGNVLLQYCGINKDLVPCIGEVNQFKFGKYTPGTYIPIVPEKQFENMNIKYKLVLPWHFKKSFIRREEKFINNGGKLIFLLPKIEIYPNA